MVFGIRGIWMDLTKEINDILYGISTDPFSVLGAKETENGTVIRTFYPDAVQAKVKLKKQKTEYDMVSIHRDGFFEVTVPNALPFKYELELTYPDGNVFVTYDAYSFYPEIDEEAFIKFQNGINYEIYDYLGARCEKYDGVPGTRFDVWAPNAKSVSVVGDFNLWDKRRNIMKKNEKYGIFSLFVPGVGAGALYKFAITKANGETVFKADPYAKASEKRPNNASVVYDISKFKWADKMWLNKREKSDIFNVPVNIYEVHLGSFLKPSEEDGSFYDYKTLAEKIAAYVKDMGYTHVELLPVMEHPFDGSWGYQVTGYYAPTARFGDPAGFMYFVNYMHKNGIGIILDWVPAHFPKDEFGLAHFDGTPLYEHPDKRRGEHPDWGTLIFDYGRKEVSNFLIANALFWVEKYHVDGIRMDAVASMLYLDYGRKQGEWVPNIYGGHENLESMEFLKHLNSVMKKRNKSVYMIAEESTAWPSVTGVVEENNSLGFTYKWNMGWMNDFLKYMKEDPLFKKGVHGCLTFSMMYAYSEKFILVLSHDEVVHGKGSLINKMPGDYSEKFANLRTAYGFMTGHPGKKLLFMGQDFAQFAEWNENKSLEWDLIDHFEMHKKIHNYCRDLFNLYKNKHALYDMDFDPKGFTWMSCMDIDHSIVSFIRRGNKGEMLLFVCNFTPVVYENFRQAVPEKGRYTEILNSDDIKYGGTGHMNGFPLESEDVPHDGQDNSIVMILPGLSTVIFEKSDK